MAGVCRVFDDVGGLSNPLFRVDVLNGLEHSPSDVQDHLHHPYQNVMQPVRMLSMVQL